MKHPRNLDHAIGQKRSRLSLDRTVMKKLVLTAVSPLALMVLHGQASAQTVSANTSSNLRTSTSNSDITINSGITVSPTSGAAVTIDSNNSVTNNGTISFTDISNTTGIASTGGFTGNITNTGTITLTETSTAGTDANGSPTGPFATGSSRYGVLISGTGTFTGAIASSGTITVTGNTSAGIEVDPVLNGAINNSSTITVAGTGSYGIHALSAVTGDVLVTGAVSVSGQGAVGVAVDGNIGGTVTVSSTISATGFRGGATVYSVPNADDLLIGGSALRLGGSVTGGVDIASGGSVISYGTAPALQIGTGSSLTLSAVSGYSYGLEVIGSILGNGVNTGLNGQAALIGGAGGTVTLVGGIDVSGAIGATGSAAGSLALELGSGAVVPTLNVTGSVYAAETNAGTGATSNIAVLVDAGATLSSVFNTGSLYATGTSSTGSETATVIKDNSGTLTSITNEGKIYATLTGTTTTGQAVAIDTSANTSGVTITQAANSASTVAPYIIGAILTGSGNDTLSVSAGAITGNVSLGAGNNSVLLSGSSLLTGNVDFGSGAGTLALSGTSGLAGNLTMGAGSTISLAGTSAFTGTIVQNGSAPALNIAGGTFLDTATGQIALTSLSVSNSGTLGVTVDESNKAVSSYVISGATSFATGSQVKFSFASFLASPQTYTFLTSGSLTGASSLSISTASLPYLYTASLSSPTATSIAVTVAPKTAAQLGLNRSGTAAYSAVFTALQTSSVVQNAFTSVTDAATFNHLYGEMLPDHTGATFLSTSEVSRDVALLAASPSTPRAQTRGLGLWVGQLGNVSKKSAPGDTQGYKLADWGAVVGIDYDLGGLGTIGVLYDWSYNHIVNADNPNNVVGYMNEIGGYWHGAWGGLRVNARGSVGFINFDSKRELLSPSDQNTALETTTAGWHASSVAFNAGAAYELPLSKRFYARPQARFDYFRLSEDAHQESGGGTGYDLAVAKRVSDSLVGTYSLAAGYALSSNEDSRSRIEVEVGDRLKMNGALASTVANFTGGQSFTLLPDALTYGPTGALRLNVGNDFMAFTAEVRAQKIAGQVTAGASAGLRIRI